LVVLSGYLNDAWASEKLSTRDEWEKDSTRCGDTAAKESARACEQRGVDVSENFLVPDGAREHSDQKYFRGRALVRPEGSRASAQMVGHSVVRPEVRLGQAAWWVVLSRTTRKSQTR